MIKVMNMRDEYSLDSFTMRLATEAPNIFLMPISLVFCSAVKEASPKRAISRSPLITGKSNTWKKVESADITSF